MAPTPKPNANTLDINASYPEAVDKITSPVIWSVAAARSAQTLLTTSPRNPKPILPTIAATPAVDSKADPAIAPKPSVLAKSTIEMAIALFAPSMALTTMLMTQKLGRRTISRSGNGASPA